MPEPNESQKPDETDKTPTKEDIANLNEALRKEREAHGDTSKRFKTMERELNDLKNNGKSDADKTAARLKALEDSNAEKDLKLRERDASDAVKSAATKAGAATPDVVWRTVKGDIEFDADGKPTNVEVLIRDLKEVAPQLFRKPTGNADAGGGREQRAQPTGDWMRSAFASRRGG